MPRGPAAAPMHRVKFALRPTGDAVCAELLAELRSSDKVAAEQAARGLKKISEADAARLYAWRKSLLAAAFEAVDIRVQWNLTIVLGRLPLRGGDKALTVELMFERLRDKSGLNRTMAMQALFDLSEADPKLRARITPFAQYALDHGTPAMQARARRLLKVKRPL